MRRYSKSDIKEGVRIAKKLGISHFMYKDRPGCGPRSSRSTRTRTSRYSSRSRSS